MMDRKEIENKIRKNKDKILEWTIRSNDNDNVFVHGYFDYNLITFDDDTNLIDDDGIKFYDHDGFECDKFPKNIINDDDGFENMTYDETIQYMLYEELFDYFTYNYQDIFMSLFNFDKCSLTIEDKDYTMYIEV